MTKLFEDHKEFFAGVVGFIEANDFEKQCLWFKWHHWEGGPKVTWEQNLSGIMKCVGEVDGRDVWVSFWNAIVNGNKVVFWHATSPVVDYDMIRHVFDNEFPGMKHTDATNAHIVFNRREEIIRHTSNAVVEA